MIEKGVRPLFGYALEGAIRAAGLEPGVRGEELSVEHLAALSNPLSHNINQTG